MSFKNSLLDLGLGFLEQQLLTPKPSTSQGRQSTLQFLFHNSFTTNQRFYRNQTTVCFGNCTTVHKSRDLQSRRNCTACTARARPCSGGLTPVFRLPRITWYFIFLIIAVPTLSRAIRSIPRLNSRKFQNPSERLELLEDGRRLRGESKCCEFPPRIRAI